MTQRGRLGAPSRGTRAAPGRNGDLASRAGHARAEPQAGSAVDESLEVLGVPGSLHLDLPGGALDLA
jgi:hypothetical protein